MKRLQEGNSWRQDTKMLLCESKVILDHGKEMTTQVDLEGSNTYPNLLYGKHELESKIYHEEVKVIVTNRTTCHCVGTPPVITQVVPFDS